jgi:invasion protein IalB
MTSTKYRAFLASTLFAAVAAAAVPTAAQDTKGLGTIVTPLEPKREVGLPDQAAPEPQLPPAAAPAAPAAQASPRRAKAGEERPKAAAPKIDAMTFADWKMECMTGASTLPCQITHSGLSADRRQVVMVISLAYAPKEKEARFQMALPLGFDVQSNVIVQVGNDQKAAFKVSRCTAQGCLLDGVFTSQTIAAMTDQKAGGVTIKTVDGKLITVPFSLSGFGAAFSEMKKKNESST